MSKMILIYLKVDVLNNWLNLNLELFLTCHQLKKKKKKLNLVDQLRYRLVIKMNPLFTKKLGNSWYISYNPFCKNWWILSHMPMGKLLVESTSIELTEFYLKETGNSHLSEKVIWALQLPGCAVCCSSCHFCCRSERDKVSESRCH